VTRRHHSTAFLRRVIRCIKPLYLADRPRLFFLPDQRCGSAVGLFLGGQPPRARLRKIDAFAIRQKIVRFPSASALESDAPASAFLHTIVNACRPPSLRITHGIFWRAGRHGKSECAQRSAPAFLNFFQRRQPISRAIFVRRASVTSTKIVAGHNSSHPHSAVSKSLPLGPCLFGIYAQFQVVAQMNRIQTSTPHKSHPATMHHAKKPDHSARKRRIGVASSCGG